jgi:hypothetical protein
VISTVHEWHPDVQAAVPHREPDLVLADLASQVEPAGAIVLVIS